MNKSMILVLYHWINQCIKWLDSKVFTTILKDEWIKNKNKNKSKDQLKSSIPHCRIYIFLSQETLIDLVLCNDEISQSSCFHGREWSCIPMPSIGNICPLYQEKINSFLFFSISTRKLYAPNNRIVGYIN